MDRTGQWIVYDMGRHTMGKCFQSSQRGHWVNSSTCQSGGKSGYSQGEEDEDQDFRVEPFLIGPVYEAECLILDRNGIEGL